MPFVEEYGTQTPIALLRQHADYGCWFDRGDLGLKKDIQDVQYIAAMNPQCGQLQHQPSPPAALRHLRVPHARRGGPHDDLRLHP